MHDAIPAFDYLLHFLLALIGAGIGIYARSWCQHRKHQVFVGTVCLLLETIITVQTVG